MLSLAAQNKKICIHRKDVVFDVQKRNLFVNSLHKMLEILSNYHFMSYPLAIKKTNLIGNDSLVVFLSPGFFFLFLIFRSGSKCVRFISPPGVLGPL